jgi:hypothetical protein
MKKTITFLSVAIAAATMSFVTKNDGREGHTGSPGEPTCNTSGCHTGNPVNDPSGSIAISAPTMTGWQYQPGLTYPIQVTVTRSGNQKFGFGFEALQSSGANGGTLSITNGTETQLKNAIISGNSRTNVVHRTNSGLGGGSKTFAFNWTAPASPTGNITFYAAGAAANAQNNSSGEFIFTTSQIITPASGVSVEELPSLSSITVLNNPISDFLEVEFSNAEALSLTFTLYSISGIETAKFRNVQFGSGINRFRTEIDESISSGIYLLHISDGSGSATKKLTIVR